jgi:hypothetical protein
MDKVREEMRRRLLEIKEAEYLLSIKGLVVVTVARFPERGRGHKAICPSISRIIKLMGLNLKENSLCKKRPACPGHRMR